MIAAAISLLFYGAFASESGAFEGGEENEARIDGIDPVLGPFSFVVRGSKQLIKDEGNQRPASPRGDALPNLEPINRITLRIQPGDSWKMKDVIHSKIIAAAKERVERFGKENKMVPAAMLHIIRKEADERTGDNVVLFQHMLIAPFTVSLNLS